MRTAVQSVPGPPNVIRSSTELGVPSSAYGHGVTLANFSAGLCERKMRLRAEVASTCPPAPPPLPPDPV